MITRPRRTVSGVSGCILFVPCSDRTRQRDLGNHLGAGARVAIDGAVATQQRDAFVHAEQSDALARTRAILWPDRAKAAPPVADLQPDQALAWLQGDRHTRSARVLADVGERLLGDPKQCRFDLRCQPLVTQI